MQCKSCSNDVSLKFQYALSANSCPFCGEDIMDKELVGILSSLRSTLVSIEKYPNEIFDWLSSNLDLVKKEDTVSFIKYKDLENELVEAKSLIEDLKNRVPQKPQAVRPQKAGSTKSIDEIETDAEGNPLEGELLQDPETTSTFFKNALIKNPNNTNDKFRKMVKDIKSGVNPAANSPIVTEEMLQSGDIDSGEFVQLFDDESLNINSALESEDDFDDEIPAVVQQMASRANGNNTNGGYNQKDVELLKKLTGGATARQKAMRKTGSVGLIKR
jgi:hypothetical protein